MQALKNRFKEFRRAPKPKGHTQSPKPSPTQPKPKQPSKILDIPETPAGEDTTSFQRHNKAIKNEYAKPKRARKMVVLNELISRSYAMRRQDVMSHSYALQDILELYPFLKEPDQVFYNVVMQHPPPPILLCMYSCKQV